jgi:hypothetical protein
MMFSIVVAARLVFTLLGTKIRPLGMVSLVNSSTMLLWELDDILALL